MYFTIVYDTPPRESERESNRTPRSQHACTYLQPLNTPSSQSIIQHPDYCTAAVYYYSTCIASSCSALQLPAATGRYLYKTVVGTLCFHLTTSLLAGAKSIVAALSSSFDCHVISGKKKTKKKGKLGVLVLVL